MATAHLDLPADVTITGGSGGPPWTTIMSIDVRAGAWFAQAVIEVREDGVTGSFTQFRLWDGTTAYGFMGTHIAAATQRQADYLCAVIEMAHAGTISVQMRKLSTGTNRIITVLATQTEGGDTAVSAQMSVAQIRQNEYRQTLTAMNSTGQPPQVLTPGVWHTLSSISCPAGTWLVFAVVMVGSGVNNITEFQFWDGTYGYNFIEETPPRSSASLLMTAKITLQEAGTITMQAAEADSFLGNVLAGCPALIGISVIP